MQGRILTLGNTAVGIRVTTCAKIAVQEKNVAGEDFNGAIPQSQADFLVRRIPGVTDDSFHGNDHERCALNLGATTSVADPSCGPPSTLAISGRCCCLRTVTI